MTERQHYRAALVALANRSCENSSASGPGACVRNGRKPVTEGPEFTGTADEMCYPCFAWNALNSTPDPASDLDALRVEVEQEPDRIGWGSIDRAVYRRDLLNVIDLLAFNEERLTKERAYADSLRNLTDALRAAYDNARDDLRHIEEEYGRNATRLQLVGEVGALQEMLQGRTATVLRYEKALAEIEEEANHALGEEEAGAPYTPRGCLIVARHIASKALRP